jgi:hypothetical protein
MQDWHIVYLSFETGTTGRQYIGKHSTKNLQDGYLGSYKDFSFCPTARIILGYYKSEEVAIWAEIQWQRVFQVVEDPSFANLAYQTTTKFTFRVDHAGNKNPMHGRKRPEHAERMRELFSGKNNPMFGTKMSEDAKEKRKQTWEEKYGGHPSLGKEGPWKGKKRPEHAEKLKGRKRPEHAARMKEYHQKRREGNSNASKNN